MYNSKYLSLADFIINDLRKNLRAISKLYLRELEVSSSLNPPMAMQIKNQMQQLASVIQNLTSFYGQD